MKNKFAHVLIICLLAISLHGFGTDEHVFSTAKNEIILASSSADENNGNPSIPNLGSVCDICQVVHQYVILDNPEFLLPSQTNAAFMRALTAPPLRVPDDILHPPMI